MAQRYPTVMGKDLRGKDGLCSESPARETMFSREHQISLKDVRGSFWEEVRIQENALSCFKRAQ